MALKFCVLFALILAPTLAFARENDGEAVAEVRNPVRRCGQYVEYGQMEINQGIFLRGGTLFQYVGMRSKPSVQFVVESGQPKGFVELLGSVNEDGDRTMDVAESGALPGQRVNPDFMSSMPVNRLLDETVSDVGKDRQIEGAGQAFSMSNTGEQEGVTTWVLDQSVEDSLRHVEATFALVSPFLFSHELSGNHFDRLIAARARAVHAMNNLRDDNIYYSVPRELPLFYTAGEEQSMADSMPVEVEDDGSSSESFSDYVERLGRELGDMCNEFADWFGELPLYLWLLMLLSLVTIVFSGVILCLQCLQRCSEEEDEAAMILSCSPVPSVKTPLLQAVDEDLKKSSAEADCESGQYEPPRV